MINFILILMNSSMMLSAMFILFYTSEKHYKQSLKLTYYSHLFKYRKLSQCFAFTLLLLSFLIFNYIFSFSIAFVSLFIFMSPIILFVILLKNNLKQKIKEKNA